MKPLNLREFAEQLRLQGCEFADEILELLVDLEDDVAQLYSELCDDIEHYAPKFDKPARALEWIGDRSNLLGEIESKLKEASRDGDVDDAVKELLAEREDMRLILDAAGFESLSLLEALEALAERANRAPEEIEVMTYDL